VIGGRIEFLTKPGEERTNKVDPERKALPSKKTEALGPPPQGHDSERSVPKIPELSARGNKTTFLGAPGGSRVKAKRGFLTVPGNIAPKKILLVKERTGRRGCSPLI